MKVLRRINPNTYGAGQGWVHLHGLHSRLPTARQRTVFDPPPYGTRKVVIATNIAETRFVVLLLSVLIKIDGVEVPGEVP